MRLLPRLPAALVLAACGVLGTAGRAPAAWNNVFQVCCHDCNRSQTSFFVPAPAQTSFFAPAQACPQPCQQPEVRVSYVQRCFYQPVTEFVRKSFFEPVTRNVTSYFYEPVTEYRYTTYYDPCTGCPQKVCTPTTSFRLRSKCNSVTSYVERCAMVPVTSLRPVTVRQPVVTYYFPPQPVCPPACPPAAAAPAPAIAAPSGPAVEQIRETPPSVMPSTPGSGDMIPPTTIPSTPNGYQRVNPNGTTRIRPDKTTSRSAVVTVRGEVVMPDQLTPRGGAKLVFVSAANKDQREYATANAYGEFDVRLPAGNWFVYLGGADGRAVYHKQVSLGDRGTYDYKVVSR